MSVADEYIAEESVTKKIVLFDQLCEELEIECINICIFHSIFFVGEERHRVFFFNDTVPGRVLEKDEPCAAKRRRSIVVLLQETSKC